MNTTDTGSESEVQALFRAKVNLLKAVWQSSGFSQLPERFKSSAIDLDGYFSSPSFMSDNNSTASDHIDSDDFRKSIISASSLTKSEKHFLEELLKSDDHKSIHRASLRLSDKGLFPPAEEEEGKQEQQSQNRSQRVIARKDTIDFHNKLFRLHERGSVLSRRSNTTEKGGADDNSITRGEGSWDMNSEANLFSDISAWIDGSQGVEIGDDGNPTAPFPTPTSSPFKILGTSAEDTSCHPHILSPPLMDSLLAFFPDSLQCGYNFWLKYSLVRDGYPNDGNRLMTMLRHCRASHNTILAIETDKGFVLGSFTSYAWRLCSSTERYGSNESFLWRMRQSRNETCASVMEQVLRESKIDVFPYTSKNNSIQFCCKDYLALGEGELEGMEVEDSRHFGNAIRLNQKMTSGSTSTSQTFDNPSLIHTDQRGEEFKVANVEVWTLTHHESLESAVRSEMHSLFLEEKKQTKSLDLLEILVS